MPSCSRLRSVRPATKRFSTALRPIHAVGKQPPENSASATRKLSRWPPCSSLRYATTFAREKQRSKPKLRSARPSHEQHGKVPATVCNGSGGGCGPSCYWHRAWGDCSRRRHRRLRRLPPPGRRARRRAAPIRPPEGLLGNVLQKACKRGILPPRDERTNPGRPLDEGRLLIGEATRRLLAIPDDVNVFQENGELVLRRKPAMKRLPSLPPLEPTAPSK